jgi:hypothetical protein
VVELSDRAWNEPRLRRACPDNRLDKPCVCLGMTGLDPGLRFDQRKADIKANRVVLEYGFRLLPRPPAGWRGSGRAAPAEPAPLLLGSAQALHDGVLALQHAGLAGLRVARFPGD